MDLATAANAPEPISIGGQIFNVRQLTMRERGFIQAFLKRELVDPITRVGVSIQKAKAAGTPLDGDVQKFLYGQAKEEAKDWPPRFGSQAWFDALNGLDDGDARLLYEILSKMDPGFTLAKADALSPLTTMDELSDLVRVAFWGAPPAPKSQGGTPDPTPTAPPAP